MRVKMVLHRETEWKRRVKRKPPRKHERGTARNAKYNREINIRVTRCKSIWRNIEICSYLVIQKKNRLRKFACKNTCLWQGVAALLFSYEFRSAWNVSPVKKNIRANLVLRTIENFVNFQWKLLEYDMEIDWFEIDKKIVEP